MEGGGGQALSGHPPRGPDATDSLHLVGFVAAGLDMLQSLQDRGLAENCQGTSRNGSQRSDSGCPQGRGNAPPHPGFWMQAALQGPPSIPEHPSSHVWPRGTSQ